MHHRKSLIMAITLCAILGAGSLNALAHSLQVGVFDPLGNNVGALRGLQVQVDGTSGTPDTLGSFHFVDLPGGNHTLTVVNNDQTVHYRSLYIEEESVALTVSLPWAALPDPDWQQVAIAVPNAGFEKPMADNQLPNWTPNQSTYMGSPVMHPSSDYAAEGQYSLQISGRHTDKSIWIRSEKMAASPGLYEATVDVFCAETGGANPQLYLEFWNAKNTRIDLQHVPISGRKGQWETVVLRANAPAETALVTVWFYCNTNYTGVTYWDNVTLARLDF